MGFWAGLGAGAAGRLIGNLSDIYGTGAHLRRVKREEALEQERASFLGRVDAFKTAGFHPLLAAGGGGFGGGGWDNAGGSIPIQMGRDREPRDENLERLRKAQADLAEIQVENARRSLAAQAGNQGGMLVGDQWKEKPSEITSVSRSVPYQTAGPAGGSETPYTFRNPLTGEPMVGNVPSKDISEPMEGMGEGWKTVLMAPMAGKLMWDTWFTERMKQRIFDFVDLLGETARARTAPERLRGAGGRW